MDRGLFLCLLSVVCAGIVSLPLPAAPLPQPREDWWVEIENARDERHFVRVATGERRKAWAPKRAKSDGIPSPDSKWIAKVNRCPQAPGQPFDIHDNLHDLSVHPVGKPEAAVALGVISSSDTVAWTPDSKRVVYLAQRDGWRAYSANPDGSDARPLTQSGVYSRCPKDLHVLPDGRAVHFAVKKYFDFKQDPFLIRLYGYSGDVVISDGVRDRILCRDAIVNCIDPSLDGNKVAYLSGRPFASSLVIHHLRQDRIDRIPICNFQPEWEIDAGQVKWRPDGAALAVGFATTGLLTGWSNDRRPLCHIGIVTLGEKGIETRVVKFPEWEKNAEGKGSLGYSINRWVTGVEVERDARGIDPEK